MATGRAEIDIDASADQVWAVIGEFGGIDKWMPGIDSCEVRGEDRIIGAGGLSITERLLSREPSRREISYSVVDGVPIDHHQATITVTPEGEKAHVAWVVEVAPDSMSDLMVQSYDGALKALKATLEG